MSDIVGTTVLLAVTVLIVGTATVGFGALSPPQPSAPRVDLLANATESSDGFITIKHAGGDRLPVEGFEIVIAGSTWAAPVRANVTLADGSASFELGRSAFASGIGRPLAAGERVDLLFYLAGGTFIGGTNFVVSSGSTGPLLALDDFLIDVTTPNPGANVSAGGTMFLSADVSHPGGRKAIDRVVVDLSEVNGSSAQPIRDDGTLGDMVAGDGTYSSFLAIPPQAIAGARNISLRAYDLDARVNNDSGSDARFQVIVEPSLTSSLATFLAEWNNSTVTNILNALAGADGLNGLPGAGGGAGGGGSPGADGIDGVPTNLTGPQGPPGANGTSGVEPQGGFGTIPGIDSITPTYGRPGSLVRLAGHDLTNITGVTLGLEGSTTAFATAFATDPSAEPGAGLVFIVPNIAEDAYVVNVTTVNGTWANAPDRFNVVMAQPEIYSISPSQARAYTQVNVTGANFTSVASVTLQNDSYGNIAVPWAVVDDGSLSFVTHAGLPPGLYDVNISTGFRWAIASLGFEALMPLSPTGLALSPTTAQAEQIVTITGTNLETVSRISLNQTNDTRIIEAGWYLDGGAIKMVVPIAASPPGFWTLDYRVELTGSFVGAAVVPETLTVIPAPGPTITSFTPQRGEPFTQVNIFGSNFVNVKSVTFGDTAVYFAVSSTNQILAVTHAGLGAGDYTLNVTTATGTALSTSTFEALPMKLIPIYNKTIFSYVGATLTAGSGTNNDDVTAKLKFQLVNASWTATAVTFNPVNFEPQAGSTPYTAMSKTCGPTDRVYLWSLATTSLHAYLSPANELDFVFGVTVNTGTSTLTTFIFTNDETRNFILPAGQGTVTVLDHGEPTNGFADCS